MNKNKAFRIFRLVLRLLIGIMFITTAVLKLFSLDEFELYIYSFEIFNYVMVTVLARLLIAFEFLLGVFLITKTYYQYTWWLTMATMIGFTLFLVYVALFRNDTNCHCFGDFVDLNPVNSIIKNLITIVALLFIRKEEDYRFRFKKWVIGASIAVAVIVPFFVFPMDALYNKFVSPKSDINMNAFQTLQQDTLVAVPDLKEGNYVVAFFIAQCEYCRLSIKKINSIVQRNDLDKERIKIFISGYDDSIDLFKEESESWDYDYYSISPFISLDITYGRFPTMMYISDNQIQKVTDLRGIEEKELVDFLETK